MVWGRFGIGLGSGWSRSGVGLEIFWRGSGEVPGEVRARFWGGFWVGSRTDLWAPSKEAGKVAIYNYFIFVGSLTASLDPKQRKLPKENEIKVSDCLELACSEQPFRAHIANSWRPYQKFLASWIAVNFSTNITSNTFIS